MNMKETEFSSDLKRLYELSEDHHDAFTPLALCKSVVEKIPSLNGEILVINNLEFIFVLRSMGVDMARMSYATTCEHKANVANRMGIEKSKTFIYNYNELRESFPNMKFDVIVGNPPYQDTNNSKPSLWPEFVRMAHDRARQSVALIVPAHWGGPGYQLRKGKISLFPTFIAQNLSFANIGECGKHFPGVGHSNDYFSFFVLDMNKEGGTAHIKTRMGEFDVDVTDMRFIPINSATKLDFDIIRKVNEYNSKTQESYNPYRRSYRSYQSDGSKRMVMASFTRVTFEKMEKIFDDGNVTNERKMPGTAYVFNLKESATKESAMSVMNSQIFHFIVNKFFIATVNKGVIDILPFFDTSKVWSDKEIFIEIGLNEEEIKYIEGMFK